MRIPLGLLFLLLFALALPFACSDDEPPPSVQCQPTDCSAMGLNCGRIDNANGECFTCGSCQFPLSCGGAGTANVCGCNARTECEVNECGDADDSCGGVIACGVCTSPAECGGAGIPNRCAILVGPGETCDENLVFCGSGYKCCPVAGRPNLCLQQTSVGGCPTSGIDLVIDQSVLRRTLARAELNVTGPLCDLPQGCELERGMRSLLQFQAVVVNTGTTAVNFGDYSSSNPLMAADMCTNDYKVELLSWKLLANGIEVRSGKLRRRCFEDTEPRGNATARATFNCDRREAGISGGWASRLRTGLGCDRIDTTGLPGGNYTLEMTVNADRKVLEIDFNNNVATATITL